MITFPNNTNKVSRNVYKLYTFDFRPKSLITQSVIAGRIKQKNCDKSSASLVKKTFLAVKGELLEEIWNPGSVFKDFVIAL